MTKRQLEKLDQQLRKFLDELFSGMGRTERRDAMKFYVTGLLLDGERKSMEPMAARLVESPDEINAMRQRLQQCTCVSEWDEREMFRRLARKLEGELPGVEALVLDDTAFTKRGKASVGVARQYSGVRGGVDNCQVAVSLHLASEMGSGCIGFRLFLPEAWAADAERRKKTKVPEDVVHQTKWQLALGLLEQAFDWGVRKHLVLADAGYGEVQAFRDGLTELGLQYVTGVPGHIALWPPDTRFEVPPWKGRGPRPRNLAAQDGASPLGIKALFLAQPGSAWKRVSWREGSRGRQSSRFCALRVRTAQRHTSGAAPGEEQWALAEWPFHEDEPTRFYLSTLPARSSLRSLVRLAKLRWRVERDYQEMKGELGLDHFEGRGWKGFHHHAALCAAAHAFLSLQRALFPPQDPTLDSPHGPPPPAADLDPDDRLLPPLLAVHLLASTAPWPVADLIK